MDLYDVELGDGIDVYICPTGIANFQTSVIFNLTVIAAAYRSNSVDRLLLGWKPAQNAPAIQLNCTTVSDFLRHKQPHNTYIPNISDYEAGVRSFQ